MTATRVTRRHIVCWICHHSNGVPAVFRRRYLLTKSERHFYETLRRVVGNHVIFVKVRLADLVAADERHMRWQLILIGFPRSTSISSFAIRFFARSLQWRSTVHHIRGKIDRSEIAMSIKSFEAYQCHCSVFLPAKHTIRISLLVCY